MSKWSDARRLMLIQSFQRAKQEGRIGQWIVTHLLTYILMSVFNCLFVFPIRLIWRLTDRNDNDSPFIHFIKFIAVTVVVYGILIVVFLSAIGVTNGGNA